MSRTRARELANDFINRGDPKGWFEALYAEASGNAQHIPWADLVPNPQLVNWTVNRIDANAVQGAGQQALIVGCGLGDDAELLAERGFNVTAFDISAEAVRWCKQRHPRSTVNYVAADLLAAPENWSAQFDLVVEIYTLQVLPPELRPAAMQALANFVSGDGSLLVIARGRETSDDPGAMPWPLARTELDSLTAAGLEQISFEDYFDQETPPVRRFRVQYRNPKR